MNNLKKPSIRPHIEFCHNEGGGIPNLQVAMALHEEDGLYMTESAVPISMPARLFTLDLEFPPKHTECMYPYEVYNRDLTIFAAAPGCYGGAVTIGPDELLVGGGFTMELYTNPKINSVIFQWGSGQIYPLNGIISIFEEDEQTHMFADDIAINGGVQQPYTCQRQDEWIYLEDSNGVALEIMVMDIVDNVVLLRYREGDASSVG